MNAIRRIIGVDPVLVLAAAAIVAMSVIVLHTAIPTSGGWANDFAVRQSVFALIGLGIAAGVSRVPLTWWTKWWLHAWVIAVAGVVVVKFVGTVVNGSRRWIDLGPISLQPSEFGKFLAIIAVSGFLLTRAREVREAKVFAAVLGMMAVPAALVFMQPDFGTAQVYGYLALGMLFFAGARWLHFAVLAGSLVAMAVLVLGVLPAVGVTVLHDYQVQRLTGFLNPEADSQAGNYQTIQAKVAIGSGGVTGRSGGHASQVEQGFLPEPQTDFIFATTVERYGFFGGALVLAAYVLLISRILRAVGSATTQAGRLVAGGVAMLLFCQVMVNVGMVVGVLPVTGVPLPMFSYGGSALWTNMAALGLVAAVLRDSDAPGARYERRTGRPVGGFGTLRATSAERARERERARRRAGSGVSRQIAGTPLTGGGRRRRMSRSRRAR